MSSGAVTQKDLIGLRKDIQDDIKGTFSGHADKIMNVLDTFMDQVDRRFNEIEKDISGVRHPIDQLTNTIDGFVSRIDRYETEQVARDAEVQRLKNWVEQIAEQTGVQLT